MLKRRRRILLDNIRIIRNERQVHHTIHNIYMDAEDILYSMHEGQEKQCLRTVLNLSSVDICHRLFHPISVSYNAPLA